MLSFITSLLRNKTILFHTAIILTCIIIGAVASSLYTSLKYRVSLHDASFVTRQFLRMTRDTVHEEPMGYALFLPAGAFSMASTQKRTEYPPKLMKKLWDRAVSGSSPLIFTEKKKGRVEAVETPAAPSAALARSPAPCTVDLASERDWEHLNMQWKGVSGDTPDAWRQEHAFVDPLMILDGGVTQMRVCGVTAPREASSIGAPVQNLRQVQREELWCYTGAADASSPRVTLLAFDPLQSDVLLPLEGQNVMSSAKLRGFYDVAQHMADSLKKGKKRKDIVPMPEMAPSYVPEMKLGAMTRGDCVFVPSFWWITAMVQGAENAAPQDVQLTRTEYLPHTAMMEVFMKTVRRVLGGEA